MDLYVGKKLYSKQHFHSDEVGHYLCVSAGTVTEIAVVSGRLAVTIKWDSGMESTNEIAQGINGLPDNLYKDETIAVKKLIDGERSHSIIGTIQR